jgi:hypothetical protein
MTTSKVDQIRTLNDRLRQNLGTGVATAVLTVGVAALGREALDRIVKTIAGTSVTPTTRTANMTSDHSRPRGKPSFSRSIILIEPSPTIPPIQPIRQSPSGSSRS